MNVVQLKLTKVILLIIKCKQLKKKKSEIRINSKNMDEHNFMNINCKAEILFHFMFICFLKTKFKIYENLSSDFREIVRIVDKINAWNESTFKTSISYVIQGVSLNSFQCFLIKLKSVYAFGLSVCLRKP